MRSKLVLTIALGAFCAVAFLGSLGCNGGAAGGGSPSYSSGMVTQPAGRTLYATKDTRNLTGGGAPVSGPATAPQGRTLYATKDTSNLLGPSAAAPTAPTAYADAPAGRGPGYTLTAFKDTSNLSDARPGSAPSAPASATPPMSPPMAPSSPSSPGPSASPGTPAPPAPGTTPGEMPGHEYGQNGPALLNQARSCLDRGDAAMALSLYQQAAAAGGMDRGTLAQAHMGRGDALMALNRWSEAVDAYTAALDMDPELTEAYLGRAHGYSEQSMYVEALEDYARAVQHDPDSAIAHNELAWILATCPDSTCLDGERAVHAAEQAVALTGGSDLSCLDTLAAAYAEAKRFDDAVATQERVVESLRQSNSSWLAQAQQRLEMYRGFKPFRER